MIKKSKKVFNCTVKSIDEMLPSNVYILKKCNFITKDNKNLVKTN